MSTAKEKVEALLKKPPEDCTLEDVQYHAYVIKKIWHGLKRADTEGVLNQQEVDRQFSQWSHQ